MHLSAWSATLTRWIFRPSLLKKADTRKDLDRLADESRLGRCEIAAGGIGLKLRLVKNS
jgi:hypothetical protein